MKTAFGAVGISFHGMELLEEYIEEGALTVYVSMQLGEFIPKNPTSLI